MDNTFFIINNLSEFLDCYHSEKFTFERNPFSATKVSDKDEIVEFFDKNDGKYKNWKIIQYKNIIFEFVL